MNGRAAIEVEDLTVAYRDKPLLWDVDMRVPSGVLMAVVGPNGAGKPTLIKAVLGLVKPAAGRTRPRIARTSVVLPAPLGPTTAMSVPAGTVTSTSQSAGRSP